MQILQTPLLYVKGGAAAKAQDTETTSAPIHLYRKTITKFATWEKRLHSITKKYNMMTIEKRGLYVTHTEEAEMETLDQFRP